MSTSDTLVTDVRPALRNIVFSLVVAGLAVFLAGSPAAAIENEDCLDCHGIEAPVIDAELFLKTVHGENDLACVDCHSDFDEEEHPDQVMAPVACGECHDGKQEEYDEGVHGRALAVGIEDVPRCQDCHGWHNIFPPEDPRSQIYPLNVVETCGKCHGDQLMAEKHAIEVEDPYQKYVTSSHGRGLIKSGLLVSAVCNDCHGAHRILPHEEEGSSINYRNIPETCGVCHAGVLTEFKKSIHGQIFEDGGSEGPICTTCHQSHTVTRVTDEEWKLHIVEDCGHCHEDLIETYRETYHGQVTALGYSKPARCSDCHGSHNILPPGDPASTLSEANIVGTCRKCHEDANEKFTRYLAHGDHNDRANYPILFYTYWGMVGLLLFTFSFFGLHTLLWLMKSLKEKHRRPPLKIAKEKMYWRFDFYDRATHFLVIVSFLTLALTGLPLKFSYTPWAQFLARYLGGFETAGFIHRFMGIVTFGYGFMHLGRVFKKVLRGEGGLFWGPDSMVPQLKDLEDMIGQIKWFLGLGERPKFDRWTYWEKFDYWAVFWGVTMIGVSGLFLWMPEFFAKIFPGWAFNIAMINHSDEALLATGFIFSVHFFNSHLRPEKFPMDFVIFTGRIELEELQHERPLEYERMKESGRLEERLGDPVLGWQYTASRVIGSIALGVGLSLLLFILAGVLFH
jgi:cytochrome b subunit of formate dehydrogenase